RRQHPRRRAYSTAGVAAASPQEEAGDDGAIAGRGGRGAHHQHLIEGQLAVVELAAGQGETRLEIGRGQHLARHDSPRVLLGNLPRSRPVCLHGPALHRVPLRLGMDFDTTRHIEVSFSYGYTNRKVLTLPLRFRALRLLSSCSFLLTLPGLRSSRLLGSFRGWLVSGFFLGLLALPGAPEIGPPLSPATMVVDPSSQALLEWFIQIALFH